MGAGHRTPRTGDSTKPPSVALVPLVPWHFLQVLQLVSPSHDVMFRERKAQKCSQWPSVTYCAGRAHRSWHLNPAHDRLGLSEPGLLLPRTSWHSLLGSWYLQQPRSEFWVLGPFVHLCGRRCHLGCCFSPPWAGEADPRLVLDSQQSSCLCFLSAGMTGMHHHTWQDIHIYILDGSYMCAVPGLFPLDSYLYNCGKICPEVWSL